MKAKYVEVRASIKGLVATWEPILDLPGVTVEHRFHECMLDPENGDTTAAVTKVSWPYRWAVIHGYLPNVVGSTDTELEELVVHEYCHVLNAPMAARVKDKSDDHVELSTENVARALLATRKGPQ